MKEKWQKIFNIVSLVLLIFCAVKISWLQNDIYNLRNTVNNTRSMLQSSIDNISYNVGYELEQANNLLSDSSWNTGGLDVENKTATLYCYVVPKEYNPQKTAASLICNQTEYPMTLENGRYIAEITLPLFEESVINNVQFTEEGTIRTQQLNWYINPRYDMVPTAYINYSGSTRHNYEHDKVIRNFDGSFDINYEHKGMNTGDVKNVEIHVLVDDKEVLTEKPQIEDRVKDDYMSYYTVPFQHSFELEHGSRMVVYLQFSDDNGWIYRTVTEDVTIAEDGTPEENREYIQAEADIYDTDGNKVFDGMKI